MTALADIIEDEAAARADCVDDGDRAQYLAAAEVRDALANRYPPPADPQARRPDGTIVCCDCDGPIPPDRLSAMPQAVRCIDCQGLVERMDAYTQYRGAP